MARIINITKTASYGNRYNDPVDVRCIYESARLPDMSPCVVLKTYNPHSKKGQVSQTLHITKDVAKQLIEIFKTEFQL